MRLLQTMNFVEEKRVAVYELLAAILHLGNVQVSACVRVCRSPLVLPPCTACLHPHTRVLTHSHTLHSTLHTPYIHARTLHTPYIHARTGAPVARTVAQAYSARMCLFAVSSAVCVLRACVCVCVCVCVYVCVCHVFLFMLLFSV